MLTRIAGIFAFLLLIGALSPATMARPDGVPQEGLRTVSLRIVGHDGATHDYTVEVAGTRQQQQTGMMFRTDVPEGTGMLFPVRSPRAVAFWMRNTLIPLDIIFIGEGRRILNIARSATPLSEEPIPSAGRTLAVLELAGGETLRKDIRAGDRVEW